jgi:hypothetical protein
LASISSMMFPISSCRPKWRWLLEAQTKAKVLAAKAAVAEARVS